MKEALRGRRRVHHVWSTPQAKGTLSSIDAPGSLVDSAKLEQLCGSPHHQGIVCEVEPYRYVDPESLFESDGGAFVVALDQVQDPQNLGAICRSAECAGVSAIVLPERRSAAVTPAVCRASAGAVEHLSIARVRNLADFLLHARNGGAWAYGAAPEAPTLYTAPDYDGDVVLVFGGESAGLRPRVRSACDDLVSIPLRGRIASLNVASAASVVMFEAARRRERQEGPSPRP